MATPPVGIQPIIFGERTMSDPLGVLDEIREAGYDGVEAPAAYFNKFGAFEVKQWFCDRALVVPATHAGFGQIANPSSLDKLMDFLEEFGGRYLICSGTKDRTPAGYDASCEVFNAAGAWCQERGLWFLYHHHAWEFETLSDGTRGIDRLMDGTDPALVGLNIDVYWAHVGGQKPSEFIRKYATRAEYYHFKDGGVGDDGKPWFSELGTGEVDLRGALATALDQGARWITYEQDRTTKPTAESITTSREYLRSLGV